MARMKIKNSSPRFREVCPLGKRCFPKKPCPYALERIISKDKTKAHCPWYLDSEQDNYCFWVYISKNKNTKKHTLQEIAKFTNTSINNIKLAETSGFIRFQKNSKEVDWER